MTSDASRFVKTSDLKAALAGRETDVLDALGIEWRLCTKSSHIRCPYPSHGGADDWRWDAGKKKAFCTCLTDGHADSVLDVLMKCEGVDIDDAKLRAAEMIGRPDLVKTKWGGSGPGAGNQRTDAVSLLQPPTDGTAPDLPRSYLAFRLGVEPADVPMPVTATAGWSALVYWDAPAKQGGKPIEVGKFPCAVFETVAADGKRHAHRIYVQGGGAGKADLGRTADGRLRDPKKSAKVAEGDTSTAGRSVVWGDVLKAPLVIVGEGVETCAAVAHAFRAEVEAGDVAVAAAITAGGVEAFQAYEKTERIVVAADRDEAPRPNRPQPTRRGERAARELGMRERERGGVAVAIALPGASGTSTDWLDIFRSPSPSCRSPAGWHRPSGCSHRVEPSTTPSIGRGLAFRKRTTPPWIPNRRPSTPSVDGLPSGGTCPSSGSTAPSVRPVRPRDGGTTSPSISRPRGSSKPPGDGSGKRPSSAPSALLA